MTGQEYSAAQEKGRQAQAYVGSILRGGFVCEDFFYFVSTRRERVPVNTVRELQYAPYKAA